MKIASSLAGWHIAGIVLFLVTSHLFATRAAAQNLPSGNYRQTCRSYSILGPLLVAECLKKNGRWKKSAITFASCDYIVNDNGDLVCSRWHKSIPDGSYLKSCRDVYIDGKYLEAECRKHNGSWRRSDIKYKNCSGDIWNDDGSLACKYSDISDLPRGGYKQTCRDIRLDGKYLKAECRKDNGSWRYTDIKFNSCDGYIVNDSGRLTCSPRDTGNLPSGSYKLTCRNIRIDGKYLEAECRKKDGTWRYTDINYDYCEDIVNDNGRLECN